MSESFGVSKKLYERRLEYNADSVEWCPIKRCKNILLCGTYQLKESDNITNENAEKQNSERVGKLYTFKYTKNFKDETGNSSEHHLEVVEERKSPGLLDIKWSFRELNSRATYATVNAIGELTVWGEKCGEQNEESSSYVPIGKTTAAEDNGDVLALSLDWDNAVEDSTEPQIVVSYSDGSLAVVRCGERGVIPENSWKAHDFEAWICAFNYYNTNVVYSGGDDCRLKGWDLRSGCKQATFTSKQHDLGVCSIQQNFLHETLVATGSYDEHVMIWDQRKMKDPLKQTKVGGGVWRVKWDANDGTKVAVAGMYNGFHIVDCSDVCGRVASVEKDIISSYQEHQSLAYGIDWFRFPQVDTESESNGNLLASCSFYDNLLTLWSF